jgi:hypothetical protein
MTKSLVYPDPADLSYVTRDPAYEFGDDDHKVFAGRGLDLTVWPWRTWYWFEQHIVTDEDEYIEYWGWVCVS